MPTYYVDASRPDNAGNGLTPETAKRTIRGARLAATGGDTILVRAGQCHDPDGGQYLLTPFAGTAGFILDAYGDGDRPLWDNLVYQNPGASGWTHVSGGVWKKTFAAWYTRRVFAASRNNGVSISSRIVGPALRRAPVSGVTNTTQNASEAAIVAALSASAPWAPGGAATGFALYVWTGSDLVSPPDFYEGLAFIHADGATFGAVNPIELWDIQNVQIRNQHFRGVGTSAIRINAQNDRSRDTRDILIEDCVVTHIHQSAIVARRNPQSSPTWAIFNVLAKRIVVDYATSAAEQEQTTAENGLSGTGDGLVADMGANHVRFDSCVVKDAFHIGIVFGSSVSNQQQSTYCSAVDCRVEFSPFTTYSRGFATYNGVGHVIERNTVVGQNVRSQFAGGVDVRSNRWLGCRPSARKSDTAQWLACEAYWFDSNIGTIGNDRYVQIWPTAVRVYGNFVDLGEQAQDMAQFNSYTSAFPVGAALWPAASATVANNVVLGRASTAVLRATNAGGNAPVIPTPDVRNNCFVSSAPGLSNRVVWNGVNSGVNGAAGFSGNVEVEPMANSDGRPMVGSPLIRAGVHVMYHRDADQRQRHNPPSIGAYDGAVFSRYRAP